MTSLTFFRNPSLFKRGICWFLILGQFSLPLQAMDPSDRVSPHPLSRSSSVLRDVGGESRLLALRDQFLKETEAYPILRPRLKDWLEAQGTLSEAERTHLFEDKGRLKGVLDDLEKKGQISPADRVSLEAEEGAPLELRGDHPRPTHRKYYLKF